MIKYYNDEVEESYSCKTLINGKETSNIYDKISNSDAGINIVSLYKDDGLTSEYSFFNTEYWRTFFKKF